MQDPKQQHLFVPSSKSSPVLISPLTKSFPMQKQKIMAPTTFGKTPSHQKEEEEKKKQKKKDKYKNLDYEREESSSSDLSSDDDN